MSAELSKGSLLARRTQEGYNGVFDKEPRGEGGDNVGGKCRRKVRGRLADARNPVI